MARVGAWFAVLLCLAAAARVGADSSVAAARKARVDAAAKVVALVEAQYKTGQADAERVYVWSVRWCDAQRDAKGNLPQAAAQEHLKRMTALEALAQQRYASGSASAAEKAMAEFYRAEAEDWLAATGR